MTASCRSCGRQIEVSDSGQEMPCGHCLKPLNSFLHYAVATCVGPPAGAVLPSLEVLPEGSTCEVCGANWRLSGPCEECQEMAR